MWLFTFGWAGWNWYFFPGVMAALGNPQQLWMTKENLALVQQSGKPPKLDLTDEAVQRIAKQVADGIVKALPGKKK